MDPRRLVVVLLLVVAACARTQSLPQSCGGLGTPPRQAEVTFVAGGLYAVDPDGEIRCLEARVSREPGLQWGPQGDRVLVGDTVLVDGRREQVSVGPSSSWSAPTGKAIVATLAGRLVKVPVGGGAAKDISFLERHDEVEYHPAGTHVAVAGVDADGARGIWVATNTGANATPLVLGEDATAIGGLSFSRNASVLYFSAVHDGENHLHAVTVGTSEVTSIDTGQRAYSDVIASPFDAHLLAFRRGADVAVWDGRRIREVRIDGRPVGWLTGDRLVVASGGEVSTWRAGSARPIFRGAVSAAAVRAVMPPPPEPPIPGSGAA